MTETVKHAPGEWRYSINYGPEGEANYAFVYDANGELVSNLQTHHAIAVVNTMNAAPGMLEALKGITPILADIGYFEGVDPAYAARNANSLGKRIISDRKRAVNACWAAIEKAEAAS